MPQEPESAGPFLGPAWTVFSRAHTPFAHTLTHQPLQLYRVSGKTVQQKECCLKYNLLLNRLY